METSLGRTTILLAPRAIKLSSFQGPPAGVSSPGESHPEALVEPYMSLSTHTAPIAEPCRTLICQ
jgi:hypothetical protein